MGSESHDEYDLFSNSSMEETRSGELSDQLPEHEIINRIPRKISSQVEPRFVTSERTQLIMVYSVTSRIQALSKGGHEYLRRKWQGLAHASHVPLPKAKM
uniref:Uncharacterized protein n=1 Tax=Ditylenchus dipsaci TaxID=166011 RepID=A0A915DQB5_9BILA